MSGHDIGYMRADSVMMCPARTQIRLAICLLITLGIPDLLFADSPTHDGAIYDTSTGDEFLASVFSGGAALTLLTDAKDRYLLNDLCEVTHPTKGKGVWFFGPYGWGMQFENPQDEIGFLRQAPPYEQAACFFDTPKP
jgi:hypothetical protein